MLVSSPKILHIQFTIFALKLFLKLVPSNKILPGQTAIMIRQCTATDFTTICEIINDAAVAYKGIIPADRWHEPYMPEAELQTQIDQGVQFWCYEEDGAILGVTGIQDKGDVTLIRHAYVRTKTRGKGIGGALLAHLAATSAKPILIGTWADAGWAIEFYKKHGYRLLSKAETAVLLRKYWSIPERQVETSVVLASGGWGG
jgi:N-acetylglutamate synthase-like GNAT family acetyltransferase